MDDLITAVLIGFGFFLGRLPIDARLSVPKIKRKPKPKPIITTNRQGEVQKPVDKTKNPIEDLDLEGMGA